MTCKTAGNFDHSGDALPVASRRPPRGGPHGGGKAGRRAGKTKTPARLHEPGH